MTHWNYRIIDFGEYLSLREVYYENEEVKAWTAEDISFCVDKEEGVDGIIFSLEKALDCAKTKPILVAKDFPWYQKD